MTRPARTTSTTGGTMAANDSGGDVPSNSVNPEDETDYIQALVNAVLPAEDPEPPRPQLALIRGDAPAPSGQGRRVVLTPASRIKAKRVRWLWHGRLALGSLGLLAGREGIGKSNIAYWLAAQVTKGALPGELQNQPRAVVVAATEDSWEHTIVPRLMAAGADLDMVYQIEVITSEDVTSSLSLPADNQVLEQTLRECDAALLLLDPLMSRISGTLDTHRDSDVRQALEPIVAIAGRAGAAVFGLIHMNKGKHDDVLTSIMGSRAFSAVARSVHVVVRGPDEDGTSFFGMPKNNLAPTNLPTIRYRIVGERLLVSDGYAMTSRVEWLDEVEQSVDEIARDLTDHEARTATTEAADWLADWLNIQGGRVSSADAKREGQRAGHSERSMSRAARKLKLVVTSEGFPRKTTWAIPSGANSWGEGLTGMTGATGQSGSEEGCPVSAVAPVAPVMSPPTRAARLDDTPPELEDVMPDIPNRCPDCHWPILDRAACPQCYPDQPPPDAA